ncbi:uncharacterized protein LOC123723066 [Papilio machaon]|uniref:uncharacterized protein LOC123723066 n=1 Tax=Papilio machaon TaxID=76193 RepID=UPI001E664771|nr:uncharacterized protein LOC123723066 [Papilio machaon]
MLLPNIESTRAAPSRQSCPEPQPTCKLSASSPACWLSRMLLPNIESNRAAPSRQSCPEPQPTCKLSASSPACWLSRMLLPNIESTRAAPSRQSCPEPQPTCKLSASSPACWLSRMLLPNIESTRAAPTQQSCPVPTSTCEKPHPRNPETSQNVRIKYRIYQGPDPPSRAVMCQRLLVRSRILAIRRLPRMFVSNTESTRAPTHPAELSCANVYL